MMTTSTQQSVSIERVETLIEAYGSNTQCWPEQERDAAMTLLAETPALQQRYKEAQQLDTVLLAGQVEEQPDDALLARIVDNLPTQQVAGLTVKQQAWWQRWPTSIAAGFAVMAIVLMVMNAPQQGIENEQLAMQEMDYWLWEEVTDQASVDSSEELPTGFMGML
jgi:hypothetical protein